MPGALTPSLQESAVRLGAWVPFPQATPLLAHFTHTEVSEPTLRRKTEQAGAAYVAVQTAEVAALERDAPVPPPGPPLQQVSVDGAMVPLVGKGVWAEVKTLAIGTVQPPVLEHGQPVVHTADLSYFSRLADHQTFARLALVETHRRGVATAEQVVAVNDGAVWAQEFVDYHRPDAIRILDWGHAAEYLGDVARACFGADTTTAEQWLAVQLRELLHGDPDVVLGKLRGLRDDLTPQAGDPTTQATLATITTSLHYLEARRQQIAYAAFRAAGYPIGSGSVESAHTVVVASRLKGAGMHWARQHVDPMLALRNAVCNDRWDEAWSQISAELRRQHRDRLRAKRHGQRARQATAMVPRPATLAGTPPGVLAAAPAPQDAPAPRRPAPTHPWRRYRQPLHRARQQEVVSTVN